MYNKKEIKEVLDQLTFWQIITVWYWSKFHKKRAIQFFDFARYCPVQLAFTLAKI